MRWTLSVLALISCKSRLEATCDDLCRELVQSCEYEAFPDLESCRQGCAWEAEEGGDVEGELACVQEAACNTFDIVECEHAYGADR